jgi:hypothetical protein
MVCLDKKMFEQVLMLLVNMIIRDLNNLQTIMITVKITGQNLTILITYSLRAHENKTKPSS